MGNTMLVKGYTFESGLTSFLRCNVGPLEAVGRWVHPAQQQSPKPDFHSSALQRLQTNRPTSQTRADEQLHGVVSDPAMVSHFARGQPRILHVLWTAFIAPDRVLINFRRTFHPQRFVRALVIKLLPPQIQCLLLRGAGFQLQPNVPMHSLVPAVILWMARSASLQINAQGHPPGRQPAQSHHSLHLRKGTAVVTANGSRQSMPLKQPLKTGPHSLGPRIGHPPQLQHIPTVFVPHGQRFAALSLPVIPPAFEVHRPNIIGSLSTATTPKPPRLSRALPTTSRFSQPGSRQHPLKTALRGRLPVLAQIQLPNLARPPITMDLLETNNLTNLCFAQLFGMAVRSARLLCHPGQPILHKTLLPFISRLGTDPILLAQRPKIIRPQRFDHKLHPLVHRFFLLPRHAQAYSLCPPGLSVTHVLTHGCYLCSEPAPHPPPPRL